jgi:hypothetical protein
LEQLSAGNYLHNLKDQLQRSICGRSETAFAAGDAARDAIRTRAALRKRQQMARTALLNALGGLPPLDTPLKVKVTGRVAEPGFDIEKLIYESRPGTYVTAHLYLPRGITQPRGAVLLLCGHDGEGKQAYLNVCRSLVQAGLVVLAQDPIGQGERLSYYEAALGGATVAWCTAEHDHAGAQSLLLGDALARYFLHDALRSVDVLRRRPEVDPRRIGVTGYSGGGTQSSLMMLADPRIAAAAPGLFITSRRAYLYSGGAQDAEQIWPGLTARGIDHEDILLGMCPKPVCVLAAQYDFFPIEGTRETVARCRRLWRLCGRESDLQLMEDRAVHSCTPKLIAASARFFARHLLGRELAPASQPGRDIEPSRLWCTKTSEPVCQRLL